MVLAALAVSAPAAVAAPWTGSGTASAAGDSRTLPPPDIESDGTTAPAKFHYDFVENQMPDGPGCCATGSFEFHTTAGATGPVTLDWHYHGFHAFFQVRVGLTAFVNRGGSDVETATLVDAGPTNCCTEPSAGFSYSGRVVLNDVQAGDSYGFRMTGSNGDSNATLEGTLALALVVDKTDDSSGGACLPDVPADCSLRSAIAKANALDHEDRIMFDIPGVGVQTISPSSALPQIAPAAPAGTDSVEIDGTTQTGFIPGLGPLIELNGADAGATVRGLDFGTGAEGSVVRGLAINRFTHAGIAAGVNTVIEGNYIGTDPTGLIARPNQLGVWLFGTGSTVGGVNPENLNLISGNTTGIYVSSVGSVIVGNFIGTDVTGNADLGNTADGIFFDGGNNAVVGGTAEGARNVISGNDFNGVRIQAVGANTVLGNYIGVGANGVTPLGNAGNGIQIGLGDNLAPASDNAIGGIDPGEGNIIANSGADGVSVRAGTQNRISGNSISSSGPAINTGTLGIDLMNEGVTANDPGDGDVGAFAPNDLQNFPELDSAVSDADSTVVTGTLDSPPGSYRIEFFSNPGPTACDASGHGEGRTFLGSMSHVISSGPGGGDFSFDTVGGSGIVVPAGDAVTATATDSVGNTSEFSACETVTAPLVVNSTNDPGTGVCDASECTLREAITQANATPGAEAISFAIPGSGTRTITLAFSSGALPAITDPATIDGTTQDGFGGDPIIELDGHLVEGASGLVVDGAGASGTVIRGLIVNQFGDGSGIVVQNGADDVIVQGNYIGTDSSGNYPFGNGSSGVVVGAGSDNTQIGGDDPAESNVISGNSLNGIADDGTSTAIQGNYIGTNADSITGLGNGAAGIEATGTGTDIGGGSGERNVISANGASGIRLTDATNVEILRNYVGTNVSGDSDLGNTGDGIGILGTSSDVTVGGSDGGSNVISGNQGMGIRAVGTTGLVIQGNYVGVDKTGQVPLGNDVGIDLTQTVGALVGGPGGAAGNVVGGNDYGIYLNYPNGGAVQGNLVGLGPDGDDVGNTTGWTPSCECAPGIGITVDQASTAPGATPPLIGGTVPGARNIVSHNDEGILVFEAASGVVIQGNWVGLDAGGGDAGNASHGIEVVATNEAEIGGPAAGARNVISGNGGVGIEVQSADGTGIQGNYIGTNPAGTDREPNGEGGIFLTASTTGTDIGGEAATTGQPPGNVISGNSFRGGVIINGSETTGNVLRGNLIGVAADGTTELSNFGDGVLIEAGAHDNDVGNATDPEADDRNVIANNANECNCANVHIIGAGSSGNEVVGNWIGTADGATAGTNNLDGVRIDGGATNNTVGGAAPGLGNLIAGNRQAGGFAGVAISGAGTTGNAVLGNLIGTTATGEGSLPNSYGVVIGGGASSNTVGGLGEDDGNVISGNELAGVEIFDAGTTGNSVRRNRIDSNGGLGIDLNNDAVTPNDADDADVGPNNLQNFPVIDTAQRSGDGEETSIEGTLETAPSGGAYVLEFFRNSACDAPSGHGEGSTFLGSVTITETNEIEGGEPFSFTAGSLDAGTVVTATATRVSTGDTSEFSACAVVEEGGGPTDATLGLAPTATTADAGAQKVPLSNIPPSAVRGGGSAQGAALENIPLDNIALENIPVENIAIENIPVENIPIESIGFTAAMLRSTLGGVHLSDIPLSIPGGWDGVLAGTGLAGVPLNTITLADVYSLSPLPEKLDPPPSSNVEPLKIHQIDLSQTALENIGLGAIALGPLALENIPIDGGTTQAENRADWCAYMQAQGLACTAASLTGVTMIEVTLRGLALENIPVDSIPVENIPVDSIPIDSIAIENIELSGTALENIALENISILGTALENIAIENIGPGIVDTSKAGCGNVQDLGDAVQNNCLFPNLTLDDLVDALLPGAGPSLADLVKSLPPGFTLGDILAILIGGADYDWESLPLDGSFPIQDFATEGGLITYNASFTVSGSGAPTPVTLEVTLPAGVRYKLGSSTLNEAAIGDPQQTAGSLKLTWQTTATFGTSYVLEFQIRPGLTLGVSTASAKLVVPGLPDKTAAAQGVQIQQTLEPGSQQPEDSPQLVEDALYFGHLPRGDSDYVRIPIPAAFGSRTTIDLSHLPADYDLVVLGPSLQSLAPAAIENIPLGNPPLAESDVPLAQHTQPLPPETLQDVAIENIGGGTTLRATSDNRGQADEHVELISQGESGFYTVLVDPFEDAASDLPYMLRVHQSPPPPLPACAARQFPTSEGTPGTVPAIPPGVNTLFLVNKKRLGDTYGATGANSVLTKLGQLASRPDLGVTSTVVPVEGNPAVASAYAAWDANPCSPQRANDVVTAINALLDTLITPAMEDQVKNIVLVGGDDIVPFARIPDESEIANERTYANALGTTNNQFLGSFGNGFLMTDDVYGDRDPKDWFGRKLYVPERSLGRLVEAPGQIMAQVDQFIARSGRITPSTSLVTGYDFLIDGAQAVNAAFTGFGAGAKTLINDTWSRQDLINNLFPASGPAPQIDSINAHFDHRRALPANQNKSNLQNDLFTTADIPAGSMPGRLVFTMGCHSGVPAANAVFGPTALASDFAETVAIGGAIAYIGNTGYGLGDTVVPGYSERLHDLFANSLGRGRTIGESLVVAKQQYIATGAVLTLYDEKVTTEVTHYGLPMYRYGPDAPPPAPPPPLPTTTDSVTGLKAASFDESPSLTLVDTPNGQYYRANGEPLGGIDITPRRPVEPLVAVDVTQPPSVGVAHGAVIEHLVSPADQTGFNGAWSRVEFDAQQAGPELVGEGTSASKLQAITTFDVPGGSRHQQLVLLAGQFRSDGVPDSQGIGNHTLFTTERGKIYYSNSPDFVAPLFGPVEVFKIGSTIGFATDVTDEDQNGNPGTVKRVFFLYRDCNGLWRKAELAKAPNPSNRWSGGGTIAAGCEGVSYFGFAVDAAGNVGNTARKALQASIVLEDTDPGSITATLSGTQHSSGWYKSAVTVTLSSSASGVEIRYSVDNAPFQSYSSPFQVSGDGVHTIDFEGSDGSDGTAVAAIDTTGPAIEITTPANGGTYVLGSTVRADYTCPDRGSGAQSCSGPVASGQPINTSTVSPPPKSFTVTATDVVGNQSSKTVTYNVVYRDLLFVSNRTGNGDIYAVSSSGGTPVQLTSGPAIDAEPEWTQDGKILFSTNRDGNFEIYVMNADGSNPTRLTNNPAWDTSPSMSPNGQRIAFASNRVPGNNWDVYAMNANTSNLQRLTTNGTEDLLPTWSPDSQQIAFYSARSGNGDIYKMNATPSAAQTRLTSGSTGNDVDTEPAWFGSTIAFSTNRHGSSNFEIYTMNTSGGAQTRRTQQPGHDINPAWSADGAKIAFATNRTPPGGGNNYNIFTMNSNGSSQTPLVTHGASDVFPDW